MRSSFNIALATIFVLLWFTSMSLPTARSASPVDGAALYGAACAACHGSDGRGRTPEQLGFDLPLPDFTDCSFNSREASADWFTLTHEGGPVRAFSPIMPAFGSALSREEIEAVVEYTKEFCTDASWPRGELNLPRAMFTEKAYPEDEAVLTFDYASGGADGQSTLIWEKRFGARGQLELILPFASAQDAAGERHHGIGDIAIGTKYAFAHNFQGGRIWAVGAELALPTGDAQRGLGNPDAGGELYLAFGQALPSDAFIQSRLLVEGPLRSSATQEAALQLVVGKTWIAPEYGRSWTPMLEIIGNRELEQGVDGEWSLVPQLQVSLSLRQHVLLSIGASLPMDHRDRRDTRVLAYVLWDWYDGGLSQGWRKE